MSAWRQQAAFRLWGRRREVLIAQCVHYGAFRYGRDEPHPYETYARKLVREHDRVGAREWFVGFLRQYRPRDLGEALGVSLEGKPALWHFPWARHNPTGDGWFEDPVGFPDIVTQYCREGILWFRIEQEFFWLERAIYSIRRHGYREIPHQGITAQRFVRADGGEAFLILDGNHRLSALAALGHETVKITYLPRATVSESAIKSWPQVRRGNYAEPDARAVLLAYFEGNKRWRTTTVPAPLLERPEDRLSDRAHPLDKSS